MPSGLLIQQSGFRDYNVLDSRYNALGNGSHDDTTAIQNAINDANSAGGGRVYLPGRGQSTPYIISSPLTLYSNVVLEGSGFGNTVIQLANGSNCDMITSYQFASLTGTNSTSGVSNVGIRNLTLDGNSSGQTSGTGRCLSIYGYFFNIEDCVFRNSYGNLMYSEWSTSGTGPNPDAMEARIRNCKFHNSLNETGLLFNGPHDSIISDLEVFRTKYHGVHMGANSGGTKLVNVHAWSQNTGNSACNFLIEASNIMAMNCYADSSDTVGVADLGTAFQWMGGLIGGSLSTPATGLQIGQTAGGTPYHGSYNQSAGLATAVSPSNGKFVTLLSNWSGTNGCLWFANDGGNSFYLDMTPGGGSTYTGTISSSSTCVWSSRGLSGAKNHQIALFPALIATGQGSGTSLASSGTISTSGIGVARVNSMSGNVTGVLLGQGTYAGEQKWVINETAFTITFAASGTSLVSTGTSCVIAANSAKMFIWDSGTGLWYPHT